jgi:hypothetical protein
MIIPIKRTLRGEQGRGAGDKPDEQQDEERRSTAAAGQFSAAAMINRTTR